MLTCSTAVEKLHLFLFWSFSCLRMCVEGSPKEGTGKFSKHQFAKRMLSVFGDWRWVLGFGVLLMRRSCTYHEVRQSQPEIFTSHLPQRARTVLVPDDSIRKQGCWDETTLGVQLRFPQLQHELPWLMFSMLWSRMSVMEPEVPVSYILVRHVGRRAHAPAANLCRFY